MKERRIEKEACRRELKHPALNQRCYSSSTTEEEMRPELCVCSCLPQEGERQMQNKGTIIPSGRLEDHILAALLPVTQSALSCVVFGTENTKTTSVLLVA